MTGIPPSVLPRSRAVPSAAARSQTPSLLLLLLLDAPSLQPSRQHEASERGRLRGGACDAREPSKEPRRVGGRDGPRAARSSNQHGRTHCRRQRESRERAMKCIALRVCPRPREVHGRRERHCAAVCEHALRRLHTDQNRRGQRVPRVCVADPTELNAWRVAIGVSHTHTRTHTHTHTRTHTRTRTREVNFSGQYYVPGSAGGPLGAGRPPEGPLGEARVGQEAATVGFPRVR
jgi:hypothetical protein